MSSRFEAVGLDISIKVCNGTEALETFSVNRREYRSILSDQIRLKKTF